MDTGEGGTRLAYKTKLLETLLANSTPGILDKERIIAGPGIKRWLVPPAELAEEKRLAHERASASERVRTSAGRDAVHPGVYRTLQSVAKFFN